MKGTVKWYNETKGFGFIQGTDNNDYFVHRTALTNANERVQEGQSVEFETKQGEKGLLATNVTIVK